MNIMFEQLHDVYFKLWKRKSFTEIFRIYKQQWLDIMLMLVFVYLLILWYR